VRIAFLASHRGTNMQAVIDACETGQLKAEPAVLVCNNPDAEALNRARAHSFPAYVLNSKTHPDPRALDEAILDALLRERSSLILLAGYMKRLGPKVVSRFSGRILNIHPALLPKFGGQGMYGPRVHQAVLDSGDKVTGVTVHLVDEEYDHGRILAQVEVPVEPGDTVETLSARVLGQEHQLLIDTLRRICDGALHL
jgi:phosphoribosylglycinamide formyltransferase-1